MLIASLDGYQAELQQKIDKAKEEQTILREMLADREKELKRKL